MEKLDVLLCRQQASQVNIIFIFIYLVVYLNSVSLINLTFSAIVEFFEPSEARKAFTKLAYSKFKNLPLYLEWAPDNSLTSSNASGKVDTGSKKGDELQNEAKVEKKEEEDDEDDEEPEPDTTIFVKNLNFSTSDEELKKVHISFTLFRQIGKF